MTEDALMREARELLKQPKVKRYHEALDNIAAALEDTPGGGSFEEMRGMAMAVFACTEGDDWEAILAVEEPRPVPPDA